MFLHSPVAQIAISLTVTTANVIILAKVRSVRKMHRIMKYLIVHLALADLLFGITYGARAAVLLLEPGARTACVMLLAPAITFGGTSLTAMLAFYGYTVHCVVHFHLSVARNVGGRGSGGRHGSPTARITLVALVCWLPWLAVGCVAFVLLLNSSSSPSSSLISPPTGPLGLFPPNAYQLLLPSSSPPASQSSVVLPTVTSSLGRVMLMEQQTATAAVATPMPNNLPSGLRVYHTRATVVVSPSLCRITNKTHNQDLILFVSVVFLAHVMLVVVLQLICIAALRRRLADARKMAATALGLLHKNKSTVSFIGSSFAAGAAAADSETTVGIGDDGDTLAVDVSRAMMRHTDSRVSLRPARESRTSLSDTGCAVTFIKDNGTAMLSVASDELQQQEVKVSSAIRKSEDSGSKKRRKVSVAPAVRYLRNSTAALRIIVAVTVMFSLCWLPFIVCMLLHVVCPPNGSGRCGFTADVTFTFGALIVARGALNVFVYSVGCREFRISCLSPASLLRSLSARRQHHQHHRHHLRQQQPHQLQQQQQPGQENHVVVSSCPPVTAGS